MHQLASSECCYASRTMSFTSNTDPVGMLIADALSCYALSMKATKEYPNANTVSANVFIGLASIETSNMLLKYVLHASAIAHRKLDSHSSQPQPLNAHGNTLESIPCTSMAMGTSSSLTTTQRCLSSARYPYPNAMPLRQYPPWRNCLLSMAYQSHSTVTMAPQFASTLFLEFATDWNFDHCTSVPTNPCSNGQAKAVMKIIKGLLTNPSTQDKTLTLPYLPTAVHLWMCTCIHLVRCSTSVPCTQWCHTVSTIPTHMLLPTMTI